jgi:hypothetical protein
MIYLPESEIENWGGVKKFGPTTEFDALKKRLLSKDLKFEPPVLVDGTISYVE